MDPLDELDSLLDFEEELMEEDEATHKRSRADLQSQHEAAASLGGGGTTAAGAPDGKRPRVGSPSSAVPRPTQRTHHTLGDTEVQELLALAADSQPPSQTVAAGGMTTTTGAAGFYLPESEEQELLALAAEDCDTQPSPSAYGGATRSSRLAGSSVLGAGVAQRSERCGGSAGGASGAAASGDMDRPQHAAAVAQQQQQQRQQQQQTGTDVDSVLPRRRYIPPAREVFRIAGPSLTVTSESGERVYCSVEAAQPGAVGRRLDMAGALRRSRGGLLSESITSLLQAVEKDQYDRAVAETAAAAARARAARAAGGSPGARRQAGGAAAAGQPGKSSLWVEKYAPTGYLDLLSDEMINREVVRWLKTWDPCVFGAAPGAQGAHGSGRGFRAGAGQQNQNQHGAGGSNADPLGRPEHKVILIAGPPGLGKTTLAHICATHCGYRPVEINASDDRSAGALQSRVLDAVEMQSVMGQRRPNCVIIDEIDGATGGAEGRSGIAALLKIVNAMPGGKPGSKLAGGKGQPQQGSPEADSDDEDEEAGAGGGERSGRSAGRRAGSAASGAGQGARQQLRPLMRPIICICNDLYAPALRPLRDVAKVFHFKKPQAERLAQRLRTICTAEGLRCEKSTLRLLVERTDCDIRSCLNTLQFLAKRQSVVRQADLAGLRVGQKDMTKGAFAVWTELLQKRKAPGVIGKAGESEAQRAQRLYDTVQDFGEADLVMGGVHENVLGLRYFDMALQRTTAVLGCLGDADRLLRACHRAADFGLLKYLPAPLVALSHLVAGPDRPQLQWPRALPDCQRRAAANRALLQGWMLGVAPATFAASSTRSMVLEVLPHLMHIAAPTLRPVSQHLYSPQEQDTVRRLVDTLLCYNLRFCLDAGAEEREAEEQRRQQEAAAAAAGVDHQQQQQQGVRGMQAEPPLRFRPAVHRTCSFPGMAPKGRHLPAAVRQVVSHEADMEAIRRAEVARRGSGTADAPAGGQHSAALGQANQQQRPALTQAGPVPVTLAERMKAAGVGRQVGKGPAPVPRKGTWLDQLKEQRMARVAAASAGAGGEAGGKHKFPVLYKFHEGYTNAVKRPVLMSDLLGAC